MAFEVTNSSGPNGPRTGRLEAISNSITTPTFLFYTYRGGLYNLTSDLVDQMHHDGQIAGIDALHL